MAIVTDKKSSSKVVSSPSPSNKHKMWLVLVFFIALILVAVVFFYIVRPEVLFGKAIYARGEAIAENVPLTLGQDPVSGTPHYTTPFSSEGKDYVFYLAKINRSQVPYVCPCPDKVCPSLTQCQALYSSAGLPRP